MKDIKTAEKEFYNFLHELDMQKNFQSIDLVEYEKRKIELLQNYHKTKVESISDEEIEKELGIIKDWQPFHIEAMAHDKVKGAKWFKNKLLNDL